MSAVPRASTLLECLPFVVDNWTSRDDDDQAKPHFLTHCHKVRTAPCSCAPAPLCKRALHPTQPRQQRTTFTCIL